MSVNTAGQSQSSCLCSTSSLVLIMCMIRTARQGGGTPWLLERSCLCVYLRSAVCCRRNYLGSEISRSQMCYLWSEIWGR